MFHVSGFKFQLSSTNRRVRGVRRGKPEILGLEKAIVIARSLEGAESDVAISYCRGHFFWRGVRDVATRTLVTEFLTPIKDFPVEKNNKPHMMINSEFQADADKLEKFVSMYCRSHHKDRERESFDFTYQRIPVRIEDGPELCAECSKLLKYAIIMRVLCPLDPKPRCRKCPTNCFRPEHWESMEEVMKYAGPRSIFVK